jgi:transcriptional regulator
MQVRADPAYDGPMFLPRIFEEANPEILHGLMEAHPFAMLVAGCDDGPEIAHLPILLDRSEGPLGTLRGHVARANPLAKKLDGERVEIVFRGPHGYVSPGWYEAPHQQVPTWNYAVVHARGRLAVMAPPELRDHLRAMAALLERGEPAPWSLEALEADFVDELLGAIAGFAVTIERLEGMLKLSQNRSPGDRARVIAALTRRGSPDDAAMVDLMVSRR